MTKIKIVGVGGAGNNTVRYMLNNGIESEYVSAYTTFLEKNDLESSPPEEPTAIEYWWLAGKAIEDIPLFPVEQTMEIPLLCAISIALDK